MLVKLITIAGALAVLAIFIGRALRGHRPPAPRRARTVEAQDLVKCRSCGIYLPAGRSCSCADRA